MIIQFTDILYPLLYFFFVGIMITWKHNDIMTRNEVHAKNFAYLIFKFSFDGETCMALLSVQVSGMDTID